MIWIPCDQKCRHQQEGYCSLDRIARLTNDRNARCGYFEAVKPGRPVEQGGSSSTGEPPYGLTDPRQ